MCNHPTECVRYYYEIEDDGSVYAEYLCLACNRWLPPHWAAEIHARPDWIEDIPL